MRKEQFFDHYRHMRIAQEELERKWRALREQEEQEQMMRMFEAARAAADSAAAAVASGAGGGYFPSEYWILEWSVDSVTGDNYYLQDVQTDNEGNIYTMSNRYGAGNVRNRCLIRKLDKGGNLIWEKALIQDDPFTKTGGNSISISPDGYLYAVHRSAVRKMDTSTGNIIWEKYNDYDYNGIEFGGCDFDKNGNPWMYINFQEYENIYLGKWNTDDGSIISEIIITVSGTNGSYYNTIPVTDTEGNVYVAYDWEDAINTGSYGTTYFKFDSDLSKVWDRSISDLDFNEYDQDCTALSIDANNNIYGNGYGSAINKIDSNGNFVWSSLQTVMEIFSSCVTPSGETYWVGASPVDFQIAVIKLGVDGTYEWAYSIGNTESIIDIASWDFAINRGVTYFNDGILICATKYGVETLMKLPLTPLSGTYDKWVFTDITGEFNFESITPVDAEFTTDYDSSEALSIYNASVIYPDVAQTSTKTIIP